ncbi:MAG: ABC transporter substrate-binding protein [Cyanobacteria bacterium J06636_28]
MQLDWRLNAQFAGLCAADAHGDYRRQGLAVTLKAAPPKLDVVQTVVSQPHTIGCRRQNHSR